MACEGLLCCDKTKSTLAVSAHTPATTLSHNGAHLGSVCMSILRLARRAISRITDCLLEKIPSVYVSWEYFAVLILFGHEVDMLSNHSALMCCVRTYS